MSLIREMIITEIRGIVSTVNSSNTPLAASASFLGMAEDITDIGIIYVNVFSDVASGIDGLSVQQSSDGTNWDHTDEYTIPAGKGKNFSFNAVATYFRIIYTNGGSGQGVFRLQTVFKSVYGKPSSHRIQDSISTDDDAELIKSVLTGEDPAGIFLNVKTNKEAALSTTDFLFEIARGSIPGIRMFSIPGRKDALSNTALDDLTQIPGTIVVPSPGGIQLELVSSSGNDAAAGTGIQTIDIHYLDTNGDEQAETLTLDGLTPVNTIATNINYIQWIHANSVGTGGVAAGNISLRDTSGGVVYEYITSGGNQSLSAKYKVPNGHTGYVVGWQASGITKKIDVRLRATVERFDRSLVPGVFLFQDIFVLNDSISGWTPFVVPLKMPAGAEIKLSAISSAAGCDGAGQFDIMIVAD